MDDYLQGLKKSDIVNLDDDVFSCIWKQYERVVLESLLTAFLLDFMVTDVYGGDVDTLHNVSQIGIDPNMTYKNDHNARKYASRGSYSHKDVEGSRTNYQKIKHEAKIKNQPIKDAYEGKTLSVILSKSKGRPTDKTANLDHIVAAKTIHDDRKRVLSGLKTKDLADIEENLAWTNEHLNKSLGDDSKAKYVETHPELSDQTKKNMVKLEQKAQAKMDKEMFQYYYLNPSNPNCRQFYKDTLKAAKQRGIEMGIRQALGFVFVEVWLVTKKEVSALPPGCSYSEIANAVAIGIKNGFASALLKYKEILAKFGEGLIAGSLANLGTTLCNVFFTTSKLVVKNIREVSASVIRSSRVLLLNPDELELGDRFKMSAVILATGACLMVGTAIGGTISETPIGKMPVIGDVVVRFCSTLVSGLLSCTFLIYMDRSAFINEVVDKMNQIPTEVTGMKELSMYLDRYAAEVARIDIEQFERDTQKYQDTAMRVINSSDEQELNSVLMDLYKYFDIPWKGDFDGFMSNPENHLSFE